MPEAVARPHSQPSIAPGAALLAEIESTYGELQECMDVLHQLLDQPGPHLAQLAAVRLRLAHLRLSRGPLMNRICRWLEGKVSAPDLAALHEIRNAHQKLLEVASDHTSRWSLDAVNANWPEYRRVSRDVARRWLERAHSDQEVLFPLLRKYA